MGSVALAAKKSGARVHGIITEKLAETEPILKNIDEVTVVKTLSERKEKLIENCTRPLFYLEELERLMSFSIYGQKYSWALRTKF